MSLSEVRRTWRFLAARDRLHDQAEKHGRRASAALPALPPPARRPQEAPRRSAPLARAWTAHAAKASSGAGGPDYKAIRVQCVRMTELGVASKHTYEQQLNISYNRIQQNADSIVHRTIVSSAPKSVEAGGVRKATRATRRASGRPPPSTRGSGEAQDR